VQVNVDNRGANILGDAANEPSLAVDPTDPNHLAIGWRQFDDELSNFRQAGYAYSRDAGRTWRFRGVLEPGVFRSDPVLGFAADGTFYYASLRSDDFTGNLVCDVFASTDGGANWSSAMPAWGGDKEWIAVDRTAGSGAGNVYQAWSTASACCDANTFTRSVDGGMSWLEPVEIPAHPQWGTMDVGPDGALYIAGADPNNFRRLFVARSLTAQLRNEPPQFESVRVVDLGGGLAITPSGPNPEGLVGQLWVAVDPSNGPTAGYVYLLGSVDPPGPDPADVMFARSMDSGITWSTPVRVNNDTTSTAWQWFGTMSVAPNGRIDVVWNDTRNTGFVNSSQLYYAGSMDGGVTWTQNVALSPTWDSYVGWPNQNKIGDYYHMISDRVGASLAWAATFNGEQDVWFLRIGDYDCNGNGVGDTIDIAQHTGTDWNHNGILDACEGLDLSDAVPPHPVYRLHQNFPNPFNPATTIPFESPRAGNVRLAIVDARGRLVRTLVTAVRAGPNAVLWDGIDAGGRPVGSGVYSYRLIAAGAPVAARRMVLVR
jgi:hypothetical protein